MSSANELNPYEVWTELGIRLKSWLQHHSSFKSSDDLRLLLDYLRLPLDYLRLQLDYLILQVTFLDDLMEGL